MRTVEIPDPGDLPSLLPPDEGFLFVQAGEGLVAQGIHARIPIGSSERFASADAALEKVFADLEIDDEVRVPGTGPVAFGAFTFEAGVSGSVLVVPQVIIGRRGSRAWRTTIGEPSRTFPPPEPAVARADRPNGRVRYQGSTMSEVDWLAAVDQAVHELRSGVAHKVVLARDRRVWSRQPFDARPLVRHLAGRFPSCQTFAIDGLVGASPEVLIARDGTRVHSLVLAGTAPRDDDPGVDAVNARNLTGSDKERREHAFAVESVRAALEGPADHLAVDTEPHILRLANVMHLATTITADVQRSHSALALAGRLHPSAAICGTPTATAQDMIRRLEGMDRARYSGPVGWVDARGDGQWAIALRCAELDGARARLFAGAGIVDGSLPEAELEETRLKLRAMQMAFEA